MIGYLGAQHTSVRAASEVVPGKDYLCAMKGEYQVKQILRCIQRAAPKKGGWKVENIQLKSQISITVLVTGKN